MPTDNTQRHRDANKLAEEDREMAKSEAKFGEWLPIESAPKNGTEVLLQVRRRAGIDGKCLVGHWMGGGHCIEGHPPIDSGWYFWNGCLFDKAAEPLLWMPLPEEKP